MKKILVASTALLLVAGAAATSAIAAEDQAGVKISGDARARLVFKGSYDFGNTDASDVTFMDSRVRITVKGTAAGGAYAVGRIRLMDNKGEDNDTDSASGVVDPGNVWIDKAYIGVPFSDAFTIEAGKYRVSYGTGFFYDDINLAGFRGIVKVGSVEINPFVEWMAEGQNSKISIDKLITTLFAWVPISLLKSMRIGKLVCSPATRQTTGLKTSTLMLTALTPITL